MPRAIPFQIRPAIAADAPALAALSIQVWLATYATEGVSDLLARYVLEQFTPAAFTAWMEDADTALVVAEAGSHLVGYARLGFNAPQPLSPDIGTELCTLYVQEPFTRSGVGSALLDKACATIGERTGSDAMWLTVNTQNRRACAFYEKHGFARKGTTWFVLGEGCHENLVLARP
ncbi:MULTISPECIES: GNAT family N-acetyltransferase [unclassified Variovorax]|jgi:ribosomal protein S18 acetylase RimI-like enzyme|uniref:GNAT family N-acetyltransferase n=1 Tax=unclassified Variovorax TaxID=663243 RepID=UPI001F0C359C|nr:MULTISPECIES: GNAT family N-acetyltransferase [unclassified Variovorax]